MTAWCNLVHLGAPWCRLSSWPNLKPLYVEVSVSRLRSPAASRRLPGESGPAPAGSSLSSSRLVSMFATVKSRSSSSSPTGWPVLRMPQNKHASRRSSPAEPSVNDCRPSNGLTCHRRFEITCSTGSETARSRSRTSTSSSSGASRTLKHPTDPGSRTSGPSRSAAKAGTPRHSSFADTLRRARSSKRGAALSSRPMRPSPGRYFVPVAAASAALGFTRTRFRSVLVVR